MPLAEISQECFGFDIFQFPVLDHLMAEDAGPTGPAKPKKNGTHHRGLSGNHEGVNNEHSVAYQQCLRMYNLEILALGFDSLEQFAIVYDQISK